MVNSMVGSHLEKGKKRTNKMKKYRMQFYYENECEAESSTDATFKLVPELENWLGDNKVVFEIKNGENSEQ